MNCCNMVGGIQYQACYGEVANLDLKPLGINVSNFIDSYRNIGYTIETAIADIIDNSIFAKATRIDINMVWDNFGSVPNFVGFRIPDIGSSTSIKDF